MAASSLAFYMTLEAQDMSQEKMDVSSFCNLHWLFNEFYLTYVHLLVPELRAEFKFQFLLYLT